MKLIKKSFLLLWMFLIIVVFVFWALIQFIKPESVKELLNKQITSLTGQDSRIDGDIHWQLFPRPGIKVTNIQIGESKQKAYYFLFIDNLHLNLQLTPLMKGKLIFNEINVDGFTANINPEIAATPQPDKTSTKHAPSETKSSSQFMTRFAIDTLLLTHGQLIITDHQNHIALTDLQIGVDQLNLNNHYFSIQLKGNIAGSLLNNQVNATLNFKGKTRLTTEALTHPQSIMQNLSLDGQLFLQNLQFNQFKIGKINANAMSKSGEITLNPLNLSLYEGEAIGHLNYRMTSKAFTLSQTATGLNAKQLLNDLTGNNLLKGKLDFSLHASGNLSEPNWQNRLQAKGNVTIKDGFLNFADIKKLVNHIAETIDLLMTQKSFDASLASLLDNMNLAAYQEGKTKFQLLSIQYDLKHDLLFNDSLLLQAEQLQVKGYGQIDLNNLSIANELLIKLLTSDKTINKIQELFDNGLPFKLSGKMSMPMIYPDLRKISPVISTYLLKKSFDKPLKKLQKGLEEWLR
ncbi:AsmA family protein [Legionella oakridgensis]|uniref:Protein involved in outer membrane biogenesis n=2 Tax=Legionella oakridgensis TaxID=29423 RepID=W0BFG8_9GAMM|nr:AsmA family protein [Legionella oakridgensis]AHE67431.1 protein involved in outer membrane biogenesis [Legionella oakridgensis ATCC 33761 = DSM 21215]ETO92963.1 protein involved in outer membrane biogenesis [Legionella oakridgensis RV-2-2007]KTD43491.1 putative asmA protein [Legionella oakridgensis]STY20483.1 putative asmA protein [Legionella longbeachae]